MPDGPYLPTGGGILLRASRSVGLRGASGGIDHGALSGLQGGAMVQCVGTVLTTATIRILVDGLR
jgi:hypothetical protein